MTGWLRHQSLPKIPFVTWWTFDQSALETSLSSWIIYLLVLIPVVSAAREGHPDQARDALQEEPLCHGHQVSYIWQTLFSEFGYTWKYNQTLNTAISQFMRPQRQYLERPIFPLSGRQDGRCCKWVSRNESRPIEEIFDWLIECSSLKDENDILQLHKRKPCSKVVIWGVLWGLLRGSVRVAREKSKPVDPSPRMSTVTFEPCEGAWNVKRPYCLLFLRFTYKIASYHVFSWRSGGGGGGLCVCVCVCVCLCF